jgi:hypothetical protein
MQRSRSGSARASPLPSPTSLPSCCNLRLDTGLRLPPVAKAVASLADRVVGTWQVIREAAIELISYLTMSPVQVGGVDSQHLEILRVRPLLAFTMTPVPLSAPWWVRAFARTSPSAGA